MTGGLDMAPGEYIGQIRKTKRGETFVWNVAGWVWRPRGVRP